MTQETTQIRILSVDMRSKSRYDIQKELQEQFDELKKDKLNIIGQVSPLPSPNTAWQYFVVTCAPEIGRKSSFPKTEIKRDE